MDVGDIILEQLASAEAVLTSDEKELGVCLLDIGGGTTDIALFCEGHIRHTAVLAIGGNHLTNDIAVGLRTPTRDAEMIKRKYGCVLSSMVDPEESIEVPSIGDRKPRSLARHILAEIIEPRVEELFTLVSREIARSGFEEQLAAGVVLTGGSSMTEGMVELAEEVFNKPVHLGLPQGIGGLTDVVQSPIYATAVGLVQFASKNEREMSRHVAPVGGGQQVQGLFQRMRLWLGDFF